MLTAWFAAARAHARSELAALLAAGCDVNARDGDGRTALHHSLAPYGGNPDLAMFLVAHGADVNAKDRDGLDPVTYGSSHVSSGTEANMIAHVGDRFEEHGWRGRRWRSSGNAGAGAKKKREPSTDLERWFAAADRRDIAELARMLAAGFDINARAANGWTAVFSAAGPWGGSPEMMRWLMDHGADPTVRDNEGRTAFDVGKKEISSALEHNDFQECVRICAEHGKPEAPKERRRTKADFLGNWRVVAGPDAGARVSINEARISGDLRWARLTIDRIELDPQGRLRLDGDHAGELVHVSISLDESGRAHLSWSDGVTFPADLLLKR